MLHVMSAGHYARTFPLHALWPLWAIVVLATALTVYGDRGAADAADADGGWSATCGSPTGCGR